MATPIKRLLWISIAGLIGCALAAALTAWPRAAQHERGETATERKEPQGSQAAAGARDAGPPLVATTPAEIREIVRFTRAAGQSDATRLRELALRSPDALVAANAVRALGRLDAFAGDAALVALLDDPRVRVRQESVRALGESGGPEAAGRLDTLLDDPPLRHLAIRALGLVGGPGAEERLEALLTDAGSTAADRAFAGEALRAARERSSPEAGGGPDGKKP